MGEQLNDEKLREAFAKFDKNGDGSIHTKVAIIRLSN
jgi:Ca2+-binding EF-hand superfamily protein